MKFPAKGDLVSVRLEPKLGINSPTKLYIFLKFSSFIHGSILPLNVDLTRPVAGRYVVWNNECRRAELHVSHDILAEVTVIGHA